LLYCYFVGVWLLLLWLVVALLMVVRGCVVVSLSMFLINVVVIVVVVVDKDESRYLAELVFSLNNKKTKEWISINFNRAYLTKKLRF
jgi:hypothetical protein